MMDPMDTTKVHLVRSGKGCDMLCVDNYLYHYDDRGDKSYRWVCNKRKDKLIPCRGRLITTTVDGDESQHRITKVVGEHSHPRCTATEISKAFTRKRVADLASEPINLINKSKKRRERRIEEIEEALLQEGFDSDEAMQQAEPVNDSITTDEPTDETYLEEFIEEWITYPEPEQEVEETPAPSPSPQKKVNIPTKTNPPYFADGEVYMLKGPGDRLLACLDGQLYRLDGTSQSEMIYRWQCVRLRLECTTYLYTEGSTGSGHRFKQLQGEHTHEPYTAVKLSKVISQNKLSLVLESDRLPAVAQKDPIEFRSEPDEVSDAPWATRVIKRLSFRPRRTDVDKTFELVEDPHSALVDKTLPSYVPQTKFTFMPSAKGNKVLCMDNFIYHFDSRSNSNGHSYWTCVLRRDKQHKCTGRITTKLTPEGPRIVKVSGAHSHPDNANDIRRRLYKSFVAKKAINTKMRPNEILQTSIDELGSDFKRMVARSKEAIERRIVRLRKKQQQQAAMQDYALQVANAADAEDSMSSLPSELESEMDDKVQLPDSLDEMRTCTDSETAGVDDVGFEVKLMPKSDMFNVDDIIEELPMDEEYLDVSYECANEEFFDEKPPEDTLAIKERKRKAKDIIDPDMDISKVSTLRSAKGGELLCVDGYIYHVKSVQKTRTYWACIKCKDRSFKCSSRVATTNMADGLKVVKVSNHHSHPVYESDIKRRLCNELTKTKKSKSVLRSKDLRELPLSDLSEDYAQLVANSQGAETRRQLRLQEVQQVQEEEYVEMIDVVEYEEAGIEESTESCDMKLYAVSDGPPSLAVRMTLQALNLPYELLNVDYCAAEHLTEEYAKLNPQKEIPVLDDNGFYLPESIAIMQYLCDKYAPQNPLYPENAAARAVVNHRLLFNMGFYYAAISMHVMAPIFFDYQRSDMSLKKLTNALNVFETYLQRAGTKYAAAEHLTIADFALASATLCLEAIQFDLSPYPLVKKWYETFKKENPEIWDVAKGGMKEIEEFELNPPDLSHMNHPFHPTRKPKA